MLTENRNVRQEPGARRRWFEDDRLELIVWYGSTGNVEGFQLCYDRPDGGHALTWRPEIGFARSRVDAGDDSPLKNEAPILTPESRTPWPDAAGLFHAHSTQLDAPLREFILSRLRAGA